MDPLGEFQVDPVVGIHLAILFANVPERNPHEILFLCEQKSISC